MLLIELKRILADKNGTQADVNKSIADGVNATALEVQQALQADITKRLNFKTAASKRFFLRRLAKISKFAKAGSPTAVVEMENIQNAVADDMETGGSEAVSGFKAIATSSARSSKKGTILARFKFSSLGLTKHGKELRNDANGAFAIKGAGVFMRKGKSRTLVRLYNYAKGPVKIRKMLHWRALADYKARTTLYANIAKAHRERMLRRATGSK